MLKTGTFYQFYQNIIDATIKKANKQTSEPYSLQTMFLLYFKEKEMLKLYKEINTDKLYSAEDLIHMVRTYLGFDWSRLNGIVTNPIPTPLTGQ